MQHDKLIEIGNKKKKGDRDNSPLVYHSTTKNIAKTSLQKCPHCSSQQDARKYIKPPSKLCSTISNAKCHHFHSETGLLLEHSNNVRFP